MQTFLSNKFSYFYYKFSFFVVVVLYLMTKGRFRFSAAMASLFSLDLFGFDERHNVRMASSVRS